MPLLGIFTKSHLVGRNLSHLFSLVLSECKDMVFPDKIQVFSCKK
nr:MAG TPA: hypothetical protein [Caudoviricetes sp.]